MIFEGLAFSENRGGKEPGFGHHFSRFAVLRFGIYDESKCGL